MNKTDLIERVAEQTGQSKRLAKEVVDFIFDDISKSVAAGQEVRITGFGTFGSRVRAGRNGVNPLTGQHMEIPPKRVPTFKAGKALKSLVEESGQP